MTGDGVTDVLGLGRAIDVGVVIDAGAIDLFAGGPLLLGAPLPTAAFAVPGAFGGDQLGGN